MEIKFNSDDNMPLNKPLKFHNLTIIARSVFQEDNKYYSQFFKQMFVWVIKMIEYKRTDGSDRIDTNKSNKSKQCIICHYWYFKDIGYKYKQYVCDACHDLSVMVYYLDDFMILNIKGVDYICFVFNKSRNDTIKLLNNILLDYKGLL